jgi:hypothetical protein
MKAKAKSTKGATALDGSHVELRIVVSRRVLAVLTHYRDRHLNNDATPAGTAGYLLQAALLDWEHLRARLDNMIDYCEAEGFEYTSDFIKGAFIAKFPRGRLPARKRELR